MFKKKKTMEKPAKYIISFGDESEMGEIYWKQVRYFYYLLLSRFALCMDEMYWKADYYINVSNDLNEVISKITKALETLEGRDDVYHKEQGKEFKIGQIDGFVGTSFRPFFTLYKDQDILRDTWKLARSDIYKSLEKLDIDYHGQYFSPYLMEIPSDMEELFGEFNNLMAGFIKGLEKYKLRVREYRWDPLEGNLHIDGKVIGFAKDSDRRKIFNELINHRGESVEVYKLADLVGKSNAYVRSVINQIKDRLSDKGVSKKIVIKPSGKGAYKLTAVQN